MGGKAMRILSALATVVVLTLWSIAALAGPIYTIMNNGDLMWFRHDGRNDGSFRWAFNEGKKVGNGWNVRHVFSGGDGIIYTIMNNGDLMWFRHDGRNDGSFRWAFDEGRKVGNGWNVRQVFSGAAVAP
jgi:Tachylectin